MTDPIWLPTKDENPDYKCECGSDRVEYRDLDNDHGDIAYRCKGCGKRWVYEGDDS